MNKKEAFLCIRNRCPDVEFLENEPLSGYTSFRIGGPAALLARPKTEQQLKQLLQASHEFGVRPRLLGAGTNVLAPDEGVQELIICTKDALLGLRELGNGQIEAMAGETLAHTAVFARSLGLSGLEFAHGIPGTVGGGIYMNAGAYGGEMCQVTHSTTVLHMDGTEQKFFADEHEFSYRTSVFERLDCVIVKSVFTLRSDDPEAIRARMQELMQRRRSSQPLELPSAGSTFKRPQGAYAGALIEAAGLKGKGFGGAQVSTKHAGFVVNTGGATANDVRRTIELVQKTVFEHTGIMLQPEVRIW